MASQQHSQHPSPNDAPKARVAMVTVAAHRCGKQTGLTLMAGIRLCSRSPLRTTDAERRLREMAGQ